VCVCVCVYIYIYMFVCACVCVCVCVCVYILCKIFTGAYEPINWFSLVQYYIFIENHCWILLSTYSIVMKIFSSA